MLPIWFDTWPTPAGIDKKMFANARLSPALRPLKQDVVGNITEVLWVLMGTIGVVLLIACANVANLLLVRMEGRQQELATRAALGAGRGRIARELIHESLAAGCDGWGARTRSGVRRVAAAQSRFGPRRCLVSTRSRSIQ